MPALHHAAGRAKQKSKTLHKIGVYALFAHGGFIPLFTQENP